jgi:hypothetical protein
VVEIPIEVYFPTTAELADLKKAIDNGELDDVLPDEVIAQYSEIVNNMTKSTYTPIISGGGGSSGGAPSTSYKPAGTEKSELAPEVTEWINPFADVKTSDWFYGDVRYAHENGLFAGTSATTFSPNTPMTRGMLVTVLGRLYGVDVNAYTSSGFDDVKPGEYYASYVEWAKQSGIVSGIGGNKFSPDAEITRQDLAVVITRYADFAKKQFPVTLQYAVFADEADIAEYAKNAVQTLYCGSIVSGKANNLFDPKGSATRAEVAAILSRFIEAVK